MGRGLQNLPWLFISKHFNQVGGAWLQLPSRFITGFLIFQHRFICLDTSIYIFLSILGVFVLIVALVFPMKARDSTWMPRPWLNYLSWSYGFFVLSGFFAVFSGIALFIKSSDIHHKPDKGTEEIEKKLELPPLHTGMAPPMRPPHYEPSEQGSRSVGGYSMGGTSMGVVSQGAQSKHSESFVQPKLVHSSHEFDYFNQNYPIFLHFTETYCVYTCM